MPIHIFNKIQGQIGFAVNVFIVIGTTLQYENWAMEITYSLYLFIIIPSVFYLTEIIYHLRNGKKKNYLLY